MRISHLIIVALLAGGVAPAAHAAKRAGVLESAALTDGRLDLATRSCARSVCKLVVEYVPRRGRRSSVTLQWAASGRTLRQEPAGGSWGAVDLLAPADSDVAWVSGEDNTYVATAIRTFVLPGGDSGVVVDQRAGFEHLVHAHMLLVVVDGTLREIQRWVGNGSPSVTALATTAEEVIFEEVFFDPEPANPDTVTFTAYRWDTARARLVEQPRRSPVQAVVVEQYASIAAARVAYNGAREVDATGTTCLAGMAVLETSVLQGLATGKAFIGALSINRGWAEAGVASIRSCSKRWTSAAVRAVR